MMASQSIPWKRSYESIRLHEMVLVINIEDAYYLILFKFY